ncbi:Putative phospholipase/carboxylesterase family protein [Bradyrhizobium sp. ORS 278]|uniref:alpha/beta hydrolase n=1 Tax=Bradyrhizobium sp. (strain ORS 278) TaxID=114615 RepID=UPI0001507A27|nr:alpha/beta hydrolase [Bradyrhizobium sp. ORS 278]CAL74782.1 Putative phospholipase/carboxylesterase family protein [Bradyrhizobium sp. ORS 278]
MTKALSFLHRFQAGSVPGAAPLLLLHGTGGDENDLLPLGATLSPGAALLSPRGQVLEHGMPRFFRRLAEGVFDEDDVRRRALELGAFIGEARQRYHLGAPVAVGYSNGANIAAALLLLQPEALAGAALFRAMVPLAQPPVVQLARKPVLILSGKVDPIVPASNSAKLCSQLIEAGADVTHTTLPTGHQLSQADITLARDWIAGLPQAIAA